MDTEFVNVFIQKQKDVMIDNMLKCVMLETRLSLAEAHTQKVVEEHNKTLQELEQVKQKLQEAEKKIAGTILGHLREP